MKAFLALVVMAVFSLSVSAQTIYYKDGTTYEVKGKERVLVVAKDAPRVLFSLGQSYKLRNPKPSLQGKPARCARPGEIVVGPTAPCPAAPSNDSGLSLGG